jgi:nitrite reductase (NADH) small subunit
MPRVALCTLDELPVGLGRAFKVGDTPLAVFRTRDGAVFTTAGYCPHKKGPLADGMLAGNQVVCPYHAFRYDRHTGECDQPGACGIAVYPTTVEGDAVFVTV